MVGYSSHWDRINLIYTCGSFTHSTRLHFENYNIHRQATTLRTPGTQKTLVSDTVQILYLCDPLCVCVTPTTCLQLLGGKGQNIVKALAVFGFYTDPHTHTHTHTHSTLGVRMQKQSWEMLRTQRFNVYIELVLIQLVLQCMVPFYEKKILINGRSIFPTHF